VSLGHNDPRGHRKSLRRKRSGHHPIPRQGQSAAHNVFAGLAPMARSTCISAL